MSRTLQGTPIQRLHQILEFHETRLNNFDKKIMQGGENSEQNNDLDERLQGVEEHMNVIMTSLQARGEKVQNIICMEIP